MSRSITLLAVLILSLSIAVPAAASVCRNYNGHQICVLSIQRSAKNYWEYRATISVDGVKQPMAVYNCRAQVKILQDGETVPFTPQDPGNLICNFFKK
ncbi:hypothetical protein H6G04_25420 [Calothrix membranacea FACHB-236]|nr:hypothetical protein [Calothrix membranacea FACHB-236]